MAKLDYEIGSDSRAAQADARKMAREVAKLKEQLRDLGKESKKTRSEEKKGQQGSIAGLAKMAAGWVTIGAAIAVAKQASQDYFDQQEKNRTSQNTFGQALNSAIRNKPGDITTEQLEARIMRISRNAGATPTEVANSLSAAMSASGGASFDLVANTVKESLRALPGEGEQATELAVAGLTMSKTAPEGTTAKQNIGQLLATAKFAQTRDFGMFGKNVAPAGALVAQYGGTNQEGLALAAALSTATNDSTGARGATILGSVLEQAKAAGITGTPREMISQLQKSPDIVAGLKLEKGSAQGIRVFLTEGTGSANALKTAYAEIPTADRAAGALETLQADYKKSKVSVGFNQEKEFDAEEERARQIDTSGAQRARIRDRVRRTGEAAGVPWLSRKMDSLAGGAVSMGMQIGGMEANEATATAAIGVLGTESFIAGLQGEEEAARILTQSRDALMGILDEMKISNENTPAPNGGVE